MSGPRRRVSAFGVIVTLLVIGGCGLVGLVVGRTGRIANADAALAKSSSALTAFTRAEKAAFAAGRRVGYRKGWVHGAARGRAAGRRAGEAAAATRVSVAVQTSAAAEVRHLLAGAINPVPAGSGRPTLKCVTVGGGLCEVPAVIGKGCPVGSAPDPATGRLCVPRVLVAAYQQAEAAAARAPGIG
jgi:hypothetical protein